MISSNLNIAEFSVANSFFRGKTAEVKIDVEKREDLESSSSCSGFRYVPPILCFLDLGLVFFFFFQILFRKCFQGLKINIPPDVAAKGKIGVDWFLNFILPGTDEVTDLISGVRFFM